MQDGSLDTVGIRGRKSAPQGYYELGSLGPDMGSDDMRRQKAARERQREYAAQVSAMAQSSARVRSQSASAAPPSAAAAASAAALKLAAEVAAAANAAHSRTDASTPSPDALSKHVSAAARTRASISSGGPSRDPAVIERERAAEVRERARDYARHMQRPALRVSDNGVNSGAGENHSVARPIAVLGGPLSGLHGLEAEHERHRRLAEQIRHDLGALYA